MFAESMVVGVALVPSVEVSKTASGLPKPPPSAILDPSGLTRRNAGSGSPPNSTESIVETIGAGQTVHLVVDSSQPSTSGTATLTIVQSP